MTTTIQAGGRASDDSPRAVRDLELVARAAGAGALLFDRELRLRRYTSTAQAAFKLDASWLGRYVDDVAARNPRYHLDHLVKLAETQAEQVERVVEAGHGVRHLVRATADRGPAGDFDGVLVLLKDGGADSQVKEALNRSEVRAKALIDALPDRIVRITASGEVLSYNAPAERANTEHQRMTGAHVASFVLPASAWDEIRQMVAEAIKTNQMQTAEHETPETSFLGARSFETRVVRSGADEAVCMIRDITRRRLAEDELRTLTETLKQQANTDYLTGLNNRRGLEQRLHEERARALRTGERLAAVLIDCDNFKRINDRFGHAAGDVVLQEIGKRLMSALRGADHIGRIGGDEFLVLMSGVREPEALQIAERLRRAVTDSPLLVHETPITITASLGLAPVPDDAQLLEEVVKYTERALQRSKTDGKNRVSTRRSRPKIAMMVDSPDGTGETVLDALTSGRGLHTYFQPIFRLEDQALVGYELLSRGPSGALHNPVDLFRFASEHNMLTVVDLHCLRRSMRWAEQQSANHRIHTNIFPSTLLDCSVDRLSEIFEGQRLTRYCIEISEQQFIGDPRYLEKHVAALRDLGAHVAVDDVGFGRSSLEALLVLEPDVIKLDRTVVHGAHEDAGRQRHLERLLRVARTLESTVVAEGIESVQDLAMLNDLGVRYGQGFLWGTPQPVEQA